MAVLVISYVSGKNLLAKQLKEGIVYFGLWFKGNQSGRSLRWTVTKRFGSQHPHGGSQLPATPVVGDPIPFLTAIGTVHAAYGV